MAISSGWTCTATGVIVTSSGSGSTMLVVTVRPGLAGIGGSGGGPGARRVGIACSVPAGLGGGAGGRPREGKVRSGMAGAASSGGVGTSVGVLSVRGVEAEDP